jgi:hypothetical protein
MRFRNAVADRGERARISAASGARAEFLAYLFSCIARPHCLLFAKAGGQSFLPLRPPLHPAGSVVRVDEQDVEALALIEAANLTEQNDAFLLQVAAAPPDSVLRIALERLRARIKIRMPRFPALPNPPPASCFSALCALLSRRVPVQPSATTAQPAVDGDAGLILPKQEVQILLESAAPETRPGCFLIDKAIGGPLCPPHLSPARLLFDSPFHASLPRQIIEASTPAPAAVIERLEAGVCEVSDTAPRVVFAAELQNSSDAVLGAELAALLSCHGYLILDSAESNASKVVGAAFSAAADFFEKPSDLKRAAQWPSGAARKHAGYRAEGVRELFAVRDDNDKGRDEFWPGTAWRALFELQRELSRRIFSLLSIGVGLDLVTGYGSLSPSLAALFGKDTSAAASSSAPVNDACADVMRMYRYARPDGLPPGGLRRAATSAHSDVGLLTISPLSTQPGLVVLSPCGSKWIDVEGVALRSSSGGMRFIVFLGEAGARLLADGPQQPEAGLLRAPVHFVLEKEGGVKRFSAPFFLRAPGTALLSKSLHLTYSFFLQTLAQRPWVRLRDKDTYPDVWASDF